jgi:hypothetical protein
VTLGGATGIIYQQSPEEEAFNRWQHGEFLEVERGNAKRWRRELESIDLKAMAASFKGIRSIITAFWFLKFQEIDVSTDQAACEISQRRVILAVPSYGCSKEKAAQYKTSSKIFAISFSERAARLLSFGSL